MTYLPTIDELRKAARPPRVHGNGFIQVDLNDEGTKRLHVWDDDVPRQRVATPIHDHVFDMRSIVIKGTLWHVTYNAFQDIDGTHKVYRAQREEGTQNTTLQHDGEFPVSLMLDEKLILQEGSIYKFPALRLHSSSADGLTATVMEKYNVGRDYGSPRVLVPMGEEPDNDFKRDDHDVRWLWEIIARAL